MKEPVIAWLVRLWGVGVDRPSLAAEAGKLTSVTSHPYLRHRLHNLRLLYYLVTPHKCPGMEDCS